jgi:2-polyprenyl-3-methyl-5-hydroxy-6-metoxy-1,4-benzoquinol methylase
MRADSSPPPLRPEYDLVLHHLESDPGARGLVFRAIPVGSRVLDVGCDTGRFGEALRLRKSCLVHGLEIEPSSASLARARLDEVLVRSADDDKGFAGIGGYDVIVFLEVLEHLVDPWGSLRGALSALRPGGIVHAVVPSVAHISVIRRLLVGQFDYTETGVMDRSQLRWFTRRTLRAAFVNSGFHEVGVFTIPLVPHSEKLPERIRRRVERLGLLLPDLLGGWVVATGRR